VTGSKIYINNQLVATAMSGESESNGVKNGKCFVSSWESNGDKKKAIIHLQQYLVTGSNNSARGMTMAIMLQWQQCCQQHYTCSKTIILATAEEIQNRSN